jgi:hypothetical protein
MHKVKGIIPFSDGHTFLPTWLGKARERFRLPTYLMSELTMQRSKPSAM